MPIQRTHLSALGVAAILACALPAVAQNLPGFGPGNPQIAVFGQQQIENRYRIGIDCAPAPEALKVHLHLNEETGLLVNSVLDDSPSGRAGLKRHDIILEANSHPLSTVRDLIGHEQIGEHRQSTTGYRELHQRMRRRRQSRRTRSTSAGRTRFRLF